MGWRSSLLTDPPSSHGRAREKSGRKDGLCTLKRRFRDAMVCTKSQSQRAKWVLFISSMKYLQHVSPSFKGGCIQGRKPTNINQPKLFKSGIALLQNFFKYFLPGLHRKLKKIGLARRDLANNRTFFFRLLWIPSNTYKYLKMSWLTRPCSHSSLRRGKRGGGEQGERR